MFCVCVAVHGFSLVAGSGAHSVVVVSWLLIVVASLVEHRLYSAQTLVVVAQGLVALRLVESSLTRDQTHVLCIGKRILNYWTTRKVLVSPFDIHSFNRQLFIDHLLYRCLGNRKKAKISKSMGFKLFWGRWRQKRNDKHI